MASRFRIYADFDGVINPDKRPRFDDVSVAKVFIPQGGALMSQYNITYSPKVINFFDSVREKHAAELVWVSTWNEDYRIKRAVAVMGGMRFGRVIDPAGIKPWKEGMSSAEFTKWKFDAIITDMAHDPVPFIWMDDEAVPEYRDAIDTAFAHIPHMTIAPHPHYGITKSDITEMTDFFANH